MRANTRKGVHVLHVKKYIYSFVGTDNKYILIPIQVQSSDLSFSFSPPGTLWTGGTQVISATRYPGDWRDSVLLGPTYPLGTGGTRSFEPSQVPWGLAVDWRDSSLFSPQVPCGLAGPSPFSPQVPCGLVGLSHFSPPGTLGTGSSKMKNDSDWRVID